MKEERSSRSRSRSPIGERGRSRNFREKNNSSSGNKKVYVSNIPFSCRWSDLKDLFREKVGDVAFVELFEDEITGRFKGSGIVEFNRVESVEKAIKELDKYEYKGRPLFVKEDLGLDRNNSNKAPSRSPKPAPSPANFNTYGLSMRFLDSLNIVGPLVNRVFVANLSYSVDPKKLADVFNMAGKVVDIELKRTPSGTSKGVAVVEFEHPVEAVQAISMFHNQKLFDRIMNVKMDRFVEEGDSKLPGGLAGIGKGLGSSGQPVQFNKDASGNINPIMGSSNDNMNMMNMRMNSNMGGMNQGMGGGMGGMNPGMNLANMYMNNMSSMNNQSPLSLNLGIDTKSQGGSIGGFDSFDRPRSNNFQSRGGSDTVIVRNLPSSTTWQMLKDKFRDVGDIRHVDLISRGTATMRFGNERDAQRAIDLMHGLRVEGRPIEVTSYD